jgi:hypothetical protein
MITKKITTEYGEVTSNAEVLHTDNGQLVLHITSKLGDSVHEHRVTVGAVDGKDDIARVNHCSLCGSTEEQKPVSALTEAELQAQIQKHLNDKRSEAAQILVGRAKIAKISGSLA